jgi:glycine cleavage system H protein
MGQFPDNLYYNSTHEWLELQDDEATIGITDHAQHQLGDIVFVELPIVGDEIERGEEVAAVESVRTEADIYSPVSGEVIAVNEELKDNPSLVNQAPYAEGWLYKVKVSDSESLRDMLSSEGYQGGLQGDEIDE